MSSLALGPERTSGLFAYMLRGGTPAASSHDRFAPGHWSLPESEAHRQTFLSSRCGEVRNQG